MYLVRIETTFDSGHRLLDYEGKCAFPHGHTYRAEVFLQSGTLDSQGLVFDFTELKRRVKAWIDANWDHSFLVNSRDRELIQGLGALTLRRLGQMGGTDPPSGVSGPWQRPMGQPPGGAGRA